MNRMLYVYKSMPDKLPNDPVNPGWRNRLILGFLLMMLASLLVSRAMLSVSMMGFIITSLWNKNSSTTVKVFFSTPVLWGMSLLFFIPLVSGVWSEDKTTWLEVIRVKLPFLFLPLAFAGCWSLHKQHWRLLLSCFLLVVFAGTIWSTVVYLTDSAAIHEAYLKAKTMPVPMQGDHVRFSWCVAIAIIITLMSITTGSVNKKNLPLLILAGWFITYLHLLAARTGLFTCYLFLIAFLIYQLVRVKNKKITMLVIATGLLLPVIAWFLFPTFQNRFKYLRYDFDYVKNSSYLPGATDGNRLFSFKAGWQILLENPEGVGAGDLRKITNNWYEKNIPEMQDTDKLYPSNEWLVHGGFSGWAGLLLFTLAMVLPFFTRIAGKAFGWYSFHSTAVLGFMTDTTLEVQYGVFLYCFITCCWWKWLKPEN